MVVMALVGLYQDLRAVVPCLAALELEQFSGQPHHPLAACRLLDAKPFIDNPSLGFVIVPSRGAIKMITALVNLAVKVEQIVATVVGWKRQLLVSHLSTVVTNEKLQRPSVHAEVRVEKPHEPRAKQHLTVALVHESVFFRLLV